MLSWIDSPNGATKTGSLEKDEAADSLCGFFLFGV
jgi:hypothetical protein